MATTCSLSPPDASHIVSREATMAGPILCMLCDKPEFECKCDRYCCLCNGQHAIRLCVDGQYYCPDCREACDLRVVEARGE